MYAIVEIKGKQYKVREQETLYVPYLKSAQTDDTLTFDRVLLLANGDDIRVGAPTVEGAQITAKVLGHVKADKVLVFKKKRRKRYRVKRGHRQHYTQIQVEALSPGGTKKKKAAKKTKKKTAKEAAPPTSSETTEA